jgi:menaquinone-dependent protoporphyrinogen oxidase
MSKALIIYGTRYGATASTSEEMAKIFRQEGLDTQVVDAGKEKIGDISQYNLIVVGSGIQINRWTGAPEKFIKKHQKELVNKKVALFVCCGAASIETQEDEDKSKELKNKYLNEKAAKFGLEPIALGFFGGVYNYNNVPWWAKKAMEADRQRVEASAKQTEPGVYDARNWDVIKAWAKEVAQKV